MARRQRSIHRVLFLIHQQICLLWLAKTKQGSDAIAAKQVGGVHCHYVFLLLNLALA